MAPISARPLVCSAAIMASSCGACVEPAVPDWCTRRAPIYLYVAQATNAIVSRPIDVSNTLWPHRAINPIMRRSNRQSVVNESFIH